MTGFVLRVIAMATMITDHIGWNFLPNPMVLTWIGRIAFPLYAFLLAEGYLVIHKDKDRLKKHLVMLLILAVISEIGFNIIECRLNYQEYIHAQSNILTLLLGYVGMIATEFLVPSGAAAGERIPKSRIVGLLCAYGWLGYANYLMHGNFNIVGPLLVIAFYWFLRGQKKAAAAGRPWPWIKRFLLAALIFVCYLPVYFWVRSGFGGPARWWEEVVAYAPWIAGHFIAVFIVSFYNGELGYHKKWFRTLYTWCYPVHIFIIGVICVALGI